MVNGQSGNGETREDLSTIKRKLAWRMGIAGLMIVGLLVGLALFDRLSAPSPREPEAPRFTEPVPVAKKVLTQPLTPAEPISETAKDEKTAAAPESSAAPAEKAAAEPEPPPPPVVAAQPVLPHPSRPAGRAVVTESKPAPVAAGKPAEHAPAPAAAAPVRDEPAVAKEPAPTRTQPSPPRLFSGYAVQAGVFSDPRRAEALQARLVSEGIPATIESRVQVGPFKTQAEAEAARARMKELGIDSVMLMPKGVKR